MKKIHTKSPCCGAIVVRFGDRRRRCKKCSKTWRIRRKKRGRKNKRTTIDLCLRFLTHRLASMWAVAKAGGKTERVQQQRLRRSRDFFLRHASWAKIPSGNSPLIAIVDAMIFRWQGCFYTCYLVLLRRPEDKEAIITPFWLEAGGETHLGWRNAFNQIPETTRARIRAIVSDGHRGSINYATQHNWLIQRCQFHILAAIQGRRSHFAKSNHREEGRRVYDLVEQCMSTASEEEARKLVYKIEGESFNTSSPKLRVILRGFVNNYEYFRMYRYHPELHLPTTTNALESLNGSVKELQHRVRGFPTIESFKKWISALLIFKQKVTCNGSKYQPN